MSAPLAGVVLLRTDGAPAGAPVDIAIEDGRIASIAPSVAPPARRLLAMPALINAHDHARPLSGRGSLEPAQQFPRVADGGGQADPLQRMPAEPGQPFQDGE